MRAFTLIEMLVATVLSAVLVAALLSMLGGVARDRKLLRSLPPPSSDGTLDLIEWDLRNAREMTVGEGDVPLALTGNGGIDRATLAPDGRLAVVTYRVVEHALWREQSYADDAARPATWRELVAQEFRSLSIQPSEGSAVPARARIDVDAGAGTRSREVFTR